VRAADEGLENRVRCAMFRLRRPGYFERLRYSLDRNGDPDWNRQPWRSLPRYREQWEAMARRNSGCGSPPAASPLRAGPSHARPPGSGSDARPPDSLDAAPANGLGGEITAGDAPEAPVLSRDTRRRPVSGEISRLSQRLSHRILTAGRSVVDGLLRIASSRKTGYIKA
jgi:hypothetical protein